MAGLVHGAVGLVSKRAVPEIHLGLLLLAAYWLDIWAVIFGFIGLDKSINAISTHSLVMAAVWSAFIMLVVYQWKKDRRIAMVLGLVVFSHWVVDLISWPMTAAVESSTTGVPIFLSEEPHFGFGLWRNIIVAYVCELGSLIVGLVVYFRFRRLIKKTD